MLMISLTCIALPQSKKSKPCLMASCALSGIHIQFGNQAGATLFDGFDRDEQLFGYPPIGVPLRDEPPHFTFAWRQAAFLFSLRVPQFGMRE
jgi:hypothetical protein